MTGICAEMRENELFEINCLESCLLVFAVCSELAGLITGICVGFVRGFLILSCSLRNAW